MDAQVSGYTGDAFLNSFVNTLRIRLVMDTFIPQLFEGLVHRPTPWVAYSTSEWRWVARWLRAVKGKLAALIASLTLRDPGQPFATVPPGL